MTGDDRATLPRVGALRVRALGVLYRIMLVRAIPLSFTRPYTELPEISASHAAILTT
jgi:hypothetical protein